jgi:hypothetical protein
MSNTRQFRAVVHIGESNRKKAANQVTDVTATDLTSCALDSGRGPDQRGRHQTKGNKDETLKERAGARMSIGYDAHR